MAVNSAQERLFYREAPHVLHPKVCHFLADSVREGSHMRRDDGVRQGNGKLLEKPEVRHEVATGFEPVRF